jgi:gluconate 2-dehydrogenase gamma chain
MVMEKTNDGRRNFLIGAAAGGAVVAGAALVREATQEPAAGQTVADGAHDEHGMAHDAELGAFFNAADAATVAAMAERIMPGAPNMPGATDANVINYIDLALAGAYADRQDFYRRGLDQLDAFSQERFSARFAALDDAQQDEILLALEDGSATGFEYPGPQDFFAMLRTHTMEGMFADPVYGGNKDFAGWRLVGFPGAHPAFSPADLASSEAFAGDSVIGLKTTAPARRG